MTAGPHIPDDLPVVERDAVRVVVLDASDRVLLFETHDPTYPELGVWWELPGGGIEGNESYVEAAIRELHEEAGYVVTESQVGPPNWSRDASFRYRGRRLLNHEHVMTVRLDLDAPAVDGAGRVDHEDDDYFGFRWWRIDDIVTSTEQFYPGRFPELIVPFLEGEEIEEPFELWS